MNKEKSIKHFIKCTFCGKSYPAHIQDSSTGCKMTYLIIRKHQKHFHDNNIIFS